MAVICDIYAMNAKTNAHLFLEKLYRAINKQT